jgi:hypothetical protein
VWDRFADRPLWCSQQAIRNVQDQADIVLYLVHAAEDPQGAGYINMELEILTWIGVPVIVLLNQTGPPREPMLEEAEIAGWQKHLRHFPIVAEVIALDAFARCWVQEGRLWETLNRVLPPNLRPVLARLQLVWLERQRDIFHRSMHELGKHLSRTATDRVALPRHAWSGRVPGLRASVSLGGRQNAADKRRAMAALTDRLETDLQRTTYNLIQLHELDGRSAEQVRARLKEHYSAPEPVNEGVTALMSGVVSGALGGLAADVAAGGLTFGGGTIAGGILGALGGGGLSRAYNLMRREDQSAVRWSPEFLHTHVRSALLRYLTIAHFGRGRGRYEQGESPPFWKTEADRILQSHQQAINALWKSGRNAPDPNELVEEIVPLITRATGELLIAFYPQSAPLVRQAMIHQAEPDKKPRKGSAQE